MELALLRVILTALTVTRAGDGLPVKSPTDVGMSSSRLAAIERVIERGIKAGGYPGASVVVGRKGAARPVGRAVPLLQPKAEQSLDQRAQCHAFEPSQPARQLGVEQRAGSQPEFGEARQVLRRCVQHPLSAVQRLHQWV